MKTLVWGITALLATLWTGLVALTHQLSGWLLGALNAAAFSQAAGTVGSLPLPPVPVWLSPWLNTPELAALQAFGVSLVQWMGAVLPSGDALMAWIGPLLWVGWGLGLLTLLALATLAHWLVTRMYTPAPLSRAIA